LTAQQEADFAADDATPAENVQSVGAEERSVPVVDRRTEPCCPWFTCCY
jgi:hypothetical protein